MSRIMSASRILSRTLEPVIIHYNEIEGRRPSGYGEIYDVPGFVEFSSGVHWERDARELEIWDTTTSFLERIRTDEEFASFVAEHTDYLREFCEDVKQLDDWRQKGEISSFYISLRGLIKKSGIRVLSPDQWWGLADSEIVRYVNNVQYQIGQLAYLNELCERIDYLATSLISTNLNVKYVELNHDCSEAIVSFTA